LPVVVLEGAAEMAALAPDEEADETADEADAG